MTETTMTPGAVDQLDTFWDVVCDDPEMLRAEFDDLIATSWDDSPPSPPTRPRRPEPKPGPSRPPAPAPSRSLTRRPLRDAEARQRGPPR
ncbi:hypothetical protein ACQPYH_27735 [Kribbella sp. CA-245084]|uniref:hypothetical protein n=1 Tax=Kribbella sp. CA-245084 TaxID=3239940 RepID=UPI003D8ED264